MSRRPAFEPIRYAEHLEASGNFASDNSLLYEWSGTHWNALDDAMGERLAMKWIAADGCGSVNAANARSAVQTAVRWLPMLGNPSDDTVIPVQNGYLHLDAGVSLKPHEKSMGLRHVLACHYDPHAPSPSDFIEFIHRILPDEDVRLRVQEYLGYTLLSDTRFQRAQIWLGTGANGKGTLANLVQALHQKTAAVQLDCLEGFRMAGMIGASLIYCDEAPQRNINEQAMKSLIAGELVQIDRKHRDPLTVRVNGKWLILANHIPSVADQSTGFWRRFDVVPFPVEIPEKDRDPMLAKRIIAHELPGVLNWCLDGLARLLARGRFNEVLPATMLSATQAAKTETNSVHAWCNDVGIGLKTTVDTIKADAYTAYAVWCRENGMVPVASTKFWKRLPDAVGVVVEGRMMVKGQRVRSCNVEL